MTRFDTDLPGTPHLPPGTTQGMIDRAANGPPQSHLEPYGMAWPMAESLVELEESTDIDPYDMRDPNDTIGGRL